MIAGYRLSVGHLANDLPKMAVCIPIHTQAHPAIVPHVFPHFKPMTAQANPMSSKNTHTRAQRIIKKYPNRRLYDTATSTYITLAEVKQLVMEREPVTVKDAKTGDDLTRAILMQIILEEEAGGTPMFSEAMLANIIRFYGNAMQGYMGSYIEKNVQMFTDFQHKLVEQTGGTDAWTKMMQVSANPMLTAGYAEQMQKMQDQMQKQTEQMMAMFGLKR